MIPEGIETVPGTDFWVVKGDTHLGLWAKQKGHIVTDPNVFKFLKPHIGHCKVVFDVGANIGDHTRQYLDWGMEVFAFEPHPLTYQCLAHNCPEAICYRLAASDKEETLRFTHLDNVGASRIRPDGEIEVKAFPLDDFTSDDCYAPFSDPDFVKIDVEGHEPRVIAGMIETLKRAKPIIYVEINRGALAGNGFTREDVIGPLREIGYGRFTLYPARATWDDEQFDVLCEV